jgi:putative ABC transport system permease protein
VSLEITFPSGLGYTHAKQLADVLRLFRRIKNLPDVHAVSAGIAPDAGGLRTAAVGLNGHKPSTDKTARTLFYSYVAPSYFRCLSIPLLAGHTFAEQAGAAPEPSVVLSESAAAEFWPGDNPLGKKVALDASNQFHVKGELMPQGSTYEVIAIAKDTRAITPQGDDNRKAYLALPSDRFDSVPLLVRFRGDSKFMLADLGKQLRGVDPNLVVYASTLEDLLTLWSANIVPGRSTPRIKYLERLARSDFAMLPHVTSGS